MRNISIVAFSLVLASSAFAAESSSQAFLKKAIQGNYAEAKMGQLAQQNGQSGDVKNFGRMLAHDHSAANQKALDAAKSMGVTPPEEPNAKQKAPMKRCPR